MRFSWRRRKRDNATNIDLIFLILLFSMFDTVVARSFVGPIRRLQCMTCKAVNGDTTQLDQFRVRQSLPDPWCDMEPIECAPQQDTCVTVSMQVGHNSFWVGSGCDQRVNYDIPADRDGCVDLQTFTRTIKYTQTEERFAFQQVCICSDDLCNSSVKNVSFLIPTILVLLLAFLR